jgi:hypothetical protein
MDGRKPARLLVAAALAASLGSVAPSQAASAGVSRTTTLTGSFTVGENIRVMKAEVRNRSFVSVPTNGDPYGISGNPNEVTFTITICNQNGCGLEQNRLCQTTGALAVVTDTGSEVTVSSTKVGCKVEVVASVASASLPRVNGNRLESTATATFNDGALIQGSSAEGTDGLVVRTVGSI